LYRRCYVDLYIILNKKFHTCFFTEDKFKRKQPVIKKTRLFKKRQRIDNTVINLDSECEIPIIDLEEQVNNEPEQIDIEIENLPAEVDQEKENDSRNIKINNTISKTNKEMIEIVIPHVVPGTQVHNAYLEVLYSKAHIVDASAKEIESIEREINSYKILFEKINEMEVTDDTINSPYIQSEL
jgi:hypothetical protein